MYEKKKQLAFNFGHCTLSSSAPYGLKNTEIPRMFAEQKLDDMTIHLLYTGYVFFWKFIHLLLKTMKRNSKWVIPCLIWNCM